MEFGCSAGAGAPSRKPALRRDARKLGATYQKLTPRKQTDQSRPEPLESKSRRQIARHVTVILTEGARPPEFTARPKRRFADHLRASRRRPLLALELTPHGRSRIAPPPGDAPEAGGTPLKNRRDSLVRT